jgi:hypothetical protein
MYAAGTLSPANDRSELKETVTCQPGGAFNRKLEEQKKNEEKIEITIIQRPTSQHHHAECMKRDST